MENLKDNANNNNHMTELKDRVLRSSPWRTLQAESNFNVVMQLAQQDELPEKIRFMALERLVELAVNPEEKVHAIVSRLNLLLDNQNNKQPKDLQNQVQALLDEVENESAGVERWKPALLRFRAIHQLMQNNLAEACEDYALAFDACQKLDGHDLAEIVALEGMAAETVRAGLMSSTQKKCFEKLLELGALPEDVATQEEAANYGEDYFWLKLYRPYHGTQKIEAPRENNKAALDKFFELMRKGQWDEMKAWLETSANKAPKPIFKDALQETLLLRLLITMGEYRVLFGTTPPLALQGLNPLESLLEDMRRGIGFVLDTWPLHAKVPGVKGQTPLMLAVSEGDAELVKLLAPVSDISVQDYLGRTARDMARKKHEQDSRKGFEEIIEILG